MKYAYKLTDGRSSDLRFVSDNCVPDINETFIEGDVLPDIKSLCSISHLIEEKIKNLKAQTKAYITLDAPDGIRMPEWRQGRWLEFSKLYEMKKDGFTLNDREKLIYNAMIETDKGETADSVYKAVLLALQWIHQCILACNAMEKQIEGCSTYDEIGQIDIKNCTYPAFPL